MKTLRFYGKTTLSLLSCTLLLCGMQQARASLLDIGQSPLILTESVAPNLILTLDDSGSMRWAFVPDNINGIGATRRAKSAFFNPMYYNPAVTYLLPIKVNADGNKDSTPYSTTFTTAYNNGFNTARSSLNLSTGYRVTWTYDPTTVPGTTYGYNSTSNRLAQNPTADFGAKTVSEDTVTGSQTSGNFTASFSRTLSNGQSRTETSGGVTYRVTRLSSTTCSATISTPSTTSSNTVTATDTPSAGFTTTTLTSNAISYPGTANCTKSSNTYTVTATTSVMPTITTTVAQTDRTQLGVPAYYYLYDASLSACDSTKEDEDCYKLVNVTDQSGITRADDVAAGQDERENFAIWYSFYRNRALATLSAANLAFNGVPTSVRLTWQNLGSCTTLNSNNCGTNYLRKFSAQQRGNFFGWLEGVTFGSSTYLREAMARAGEFLETDDAWAANPKPLTSNGGTGATVQSPEYACRPSYQIMMTDGMWNGSNPTPSETLKPDTDNTALPDSKQYTKQHPFYDVTTANLADLAFHYWATDARPALANEVKPIIVASDSVANTQYWDPRNDPATWQHLTTYTVGLGLGSALTSAGLPWTGDTLDRKSVV